jgi:hypothetical protein
MKVEHRSGSDERQILTGMIVDPVVVGKIATKWTRDGLFASKWANLIGMWCCKYFLKYGTAPKAQIESIFGSWASSGERSKEQVQLVDKFLSGLSDEHERLAQELNPDWVVDLAGKHFQAVALNRLAEDVKGDLELNDPERAAGRVAGFGRIELGEGAGINVLEDEEAIRAVFEEESESLIEWPDALARFFGTAFERDAFLSFLGAEKSGKTWWLMEVAWRSMLQKKRVAFFEIGDMSEKQIMRRMMVRAAKHPFRPQTVLKPTSISIDEETKAVSVEHEKVEFDTPLTWAVAAKACEKIAKGRTHPYLKLSCHPNSAIGMDGIRSILQGWERDGWTPDVLVIDYADNLEAPAGANDFRHGTNLIWKQMRRASQELHCCLVTATQANAAAYDRAVLGKGNFSEDKRKLAHVTGMIGINSTKEEREKNVTRLNWVVRREAEFSEFRCIAVAHCLALSRPFVLSAF